MSAYFRENESERTGDRVHELAHRLWVALGESDEGGGCWCGTQGKRKDSDQRRYQVGVEDLAEHQRKNSASKITHNVSTQHDLRCYFVLQKRRCGLHARRVESC